MAKKRRAKSKTPRRTSLGTRSRTAKGMYYDEHLDDIDYVSTVETRKPTDDTSSNEILNIKLNNFVLNKKENIKKKLAQMEAEFQILPKDNRQQYKLEMSTPTYHIFIKNITNLGLKYGHQFERSDVDVQGLELKTQYQVNLCESVE